MNGVRTLEYFLMNQFRVLGGVKNAGYVAAERYSEALDLLHSGACLQLANGQ
ncbi:hypothetical protein A2U01_0032011, partial [Trifolium medium]|nr:hypothetical protein [Trifolium medium]